MSHKLTLRYASRADLAAHLKQVRFQDSLMVTASDAPADLAQFQKIALVFELPDRQASLGAEVLQLLPGGSLVLRLPDAAELDGLVGRDPRQSPTANAALPVSPVALWSASPAAASTAAHAVAAPIKPAPEPAAQATDATPVSPAAPAATEPATSDGAPGPAAVTSQDPRDDSRTTAAPASSSAVAVAPARSDPPAAHTGPVIPAGMGPMSWPIEKLQSDWDQLSVGEKISVAKHGGLAARRMILKLQDRQLHQFVLANPALTSDEVAAMAATTSLSPELLKQIANKPEWTRSAAVVRNLICHPKLPQDIVVRLIGLLPDLELRKLVKAGRVRDSVKRLIIKKVALNP